MLFLSFVWENYQCLLPWSSKNKIGVVIFQLYFEKKMRFDFTYLNVCWILNNSVTKLLNEEDVYQIVKKNLFKMNISLVSFLLISIFICLTISAKTDRLSRRYGDSIQSSMPTYPLSYSVIQGVFDQDGKNIRNFFRYILHYKAK